MLPVVQTLGDVTVDKAVRKKRAQGLKEMGQIFQECANAVLKDQAAAAKGEVCVPHQLLASVLLHC